MQQPPPYGQQQPPFGMPSDVQPQEDSDKIVAALSYVFLIIVGVIILVTDMKNKPYLKFHAYQSITFGLIMTVGWIIASVLSAVIIGLCFMPILFLIPFYFAYLAYAKSVFKIPVVTDLTYNIFKDCPRI
jgi:uncharacterized membrane protein